MEGIALSGNGTDYIRGGWLWSRHDIRQSGVQITVGSRLLGAMNRFEESLRLAHGKCVDENQSDFSGLADRAIDGMVSGLDRHSSYYTPLEYKAFQDDTHRRYLGSES